MSQQSPPDCAVRAFCVVVWLMLLAPLAWAADESELAPPSSDKPWVIPALPENPGRTLPSTHGATGTAQGHGVPIEHDRRYNLADLIDLAQRNNPETREAWELARQAAFAVGLVESTYAPQIAIEVIGGYQRTPVPIPTTVSPAGYFVSDTREILPILSLKWLLFDFGRRHGEEQAARANSFVANVAFTGVHQKLIFSVSHAYFALGGARGHVIAAQQGVKTAETVRDAAESRRQRGLATVVTLAQAQRQTAQAHFDLTRATGNERTAYANLIAAIGVAPDTRIEVADSSEQPLPATAPENLDRILRDALANRPDVLAALGNVEAAEGALKSQRAERYPKIGVSVSAFQNIGGFSTDGGPWSTVNKPGGSVLFSMSVPLFDGGAIDARTSVAQSKLEASRDKLDQVRDAAAQQVVSAYGDLETSLAAYAAAVELRTAAQTAYDATLDAYRQGVGTYTDLASEQASLANANAEQEDAHANVFTAAAALAFASGAVQIK